MPGPNADRQVERAWKPPANPVFPSLGSVLRAQGCDVARELRIRVSPFANLELRTNSNAQPCVGEPGGTLAQPAKTRRLTLSSPPLDNPERVRTPSRQRCGTCWTSSTTPPRTATSSRRWPRRVPFSKRSGANNNKMAQDLEQEQTKHKSRGYGMSL